MTPNLTNATFLCQAVEWHQAGHGVALAFVMQTWGSSPRPVGSLMIIRDDLMVEGSVSGGCVENDVIQSALDAIGTGRGQRLDFGVADSTAWEAGLSCGGRIAVLVAPIGGNAVDATLLQQVAQRLSNRQPVVMSLDATTAKVVASAQTPVSSHLDEGTGHFHFVQAPPRRVIMVGGGHVTQCLAPMAQLTGYDVIVIDPRAIFVTAARFPGVTCINGWPDEVMQTLAPDRMTAIVTLTHDPKIDDPGLIAALQSEAFYIACLGSRRTHDARRLRLQDHGVSAADLHRLHGPAGLNIGAGTPAEIAVSILAQMIATERRPASPQQGPDPVASVNDEDKK